MTSRDTLLAAVRANQPKPTPAIPTIPLFERASPRSLIEDFGEALVSMGGKFVPNLNGKPLGALLQSLFPDAAVVCSATPEIAGTRVIDISTEPAALSDVDVGIVRAAFGVAETGSVWLSEEELTTNALAFLAQHLLVLLDPMQIVGNLHQAYRDLRFKTARYAVLVTGPSATADIEGVLVHGAQGVRSLTVAIMPLPAVSR
jgi:L-lactate dehydrogenase complex protein LldG